MASDRRRYSRQLTLPEVHAANYSVCIQLTLHVRLQVISSISAQGVHQSPFHSTDAVAHKEP
jgi:hypothetical protein